MSPPVTTSCQHLQSTIVIVFMQREGRAPHSFASQTIPQPTQMAVGHL